MKYKKVTWMVWYRTKSGKLSSMEVDGELLSKQEAIDIVTEVKKLAPGPVSGFAHLEYAMGGPIVKRMCYV